MIKKKHGAAPAVQFLFVDNAQPPKSAQQQRRIRQHAMRNVAAAKKELGTYRKVNAGQFPVFIEQERHSSPTKPDAYADKLSEEDHTIIELVIPQSPPASGYERARINYDFDILSLSWLTSFHFSKASARVLSSNLAQFAQTLKWTRDASYLEYVPQLYSKSVLIRRVVDCVLARARKTVNGDTRVSEEDILYLYGTALAGLQKVLVDPMRIYDADVLCATQLLAMYEVHHASTIVLQ